MEYVRQTENSRSATVPWACPFNDNRVQPLSMGRSVFPEDAVARIYKPSRSVMTSGKARTKGWELRFEPRRAPFIEPLMGWTGRDDTLTQVELSFPTLDSAVRYARRQGMAYVVEGNVHRAPTAARRGGTTHSFSDVSLKKLGLTHLQGTYGKALEDAANRNDPVGAEHWDSPMQVLADATLSLDAKRSILMNWAYTEYLIDQATNEGMPENDRPSRLDEVEQALLALERDVAAGGGAGRDLTKGGVRCGHGPVCRL
ncbi:MAG: ETC complex I subunit [Pseudomonadota bacterium]